MKFATPRRWVQALLIGSLVSAGPLLTGCAAGITAEDACRILNCDTLFFVEDLIADMNAGDMHDDDGDMHDDDMDMGDDDMHDDDDMQDDDEMHDDDEMQGDEEQGDDEHDEGEDEQEEEHEEEGGGGGT